MLIEGGLRRAAPTYRRAVALMAVVVVVSVAGSVPALALPVAPRVAGFSCDSQFHIVNGANPGATADVIVNSAIAAVGPNDLWAGGHQVSGVGQPDRTLAEHWDGFAWASVPTPNPGIGNDDLWGVAAIPGATASPNNVWAVGDYTDAISVEHPMAIQWNGSGWNQFSPPSVGSGDNRLLGMAAVSATNIWAVGFSKVDNKTGTPTRTLVERYDGSTWSAVASPNRGPSTSDQLLSIVATSATDLWAVGRSVTAGVTQTLIEHYNGLAWSIATSPNASGSENTLYGVAALSPSSAWAVGDWTDGTGARRTSALQWDGAVWTSIPGATLGPGSTGGVLFSVSAVSPRNVWAVGANYATGPYSTPSGTLVEHWDGTRWNAMPSPDGAAGAFNQLSAVTTGGANVWVAGDYANSSRAQDLTLFETLCIVPPSIGELGAITPSSGNTTGGTSVTITGTNFTFVNSVNFGSISATAFNVDSATHITATAPPEAAGSVDVTVANWAGTSAAQPGDLFTYVPAAISWQQYRLAASDGSTWTPIDASALTLSFTPPVDSSAVLGGNADLWTTQSGVNQDLGIFVSGGAYGSGHLVGWKESGGNGGTFSPNAAFVQTVIAVKAGTAYTATLEWKANHATAATIYAAAGAAAPFSPTRLTAELVAATDPNLESTYSEQQYRMTGSSGSTWQDMDPYALALNFYAVTSGNAMISVNADLWTKDAGINQDVGIFISGGSFGSGQIVGWKESGGFAGTFSPNAAYGQAVVPFAASTSYFVRVQWKANHATAGTIYDAAGAGPAFSPTRLTLRFFSQGTGLQDASSTRQYTTDRNPYPNSVQYWQPIDTTNLQLSVTPTSSALYILSGNADLWTDTVGLNQDIGIFISGGTFGSGFLAWKESGGFAGTFSPNAAYVHAVVPLAAGVAYTITLEWKGNHASFGNIYAGAGSGPGVFSPTRLTAQLVN
jgi:hypothetical protein